MAGEDAVQAISITADDGNGNTAQCDFSVQLVDTTSPGISCPNPAAVRLDSQCRASLPDYTGDASVSDNCSALNDLVIDQNPVPGLNYSGDNFTEIVRLTVTDNSGNTAQCSFTISFQDSSPPEVSCPANQSLATDDGCQVSLPDYLNEVQRTDNCQATAAIALRQFPAAGILYSGDGSVVDVTVIADDGLGNVDSCLFQVRLEDNAEPGIQCPVNMVQHADAQCDTVVLDYTALALTDNSCQSAAGLVTVSQLPLPGLIISGHLTTQAITLTATDTSGNDSSCSFLISIIDTTDPAISCPADAIINLDAGCQAFLNDYTSQAIISDNCQEDTAIVLRQRPAPGFVSTGHNTKLVVELTADDTHGNTQTCTFDLTFVDNAIPTIVCPADTIVSLDGQCEASIGDFTSLANKDDNCTPPGSIVVSQQPMPGFVLSGHLSSQTVTLTADDGNGNLDSCTFEFSTEDNTNPSITCPGTQTRYTDAACEAAIGDIRPLVQANDNCTASPLISQNLPSSTLIQGHNASQTITLSADDGNGQVVSCQVSIVLVDTTAPGIMCPADSTVFVDGNCEAAVPDFTGLAMVSDNCADSAAIVVSQRPARGTTFSGDDVVETILLTAADGNGNFSQCTLNLVLQDTTRPAIACPPDITLVVDGSCEVLLADYRNSLAKSDNCAAPADILVSQVPAAGLVMQGDSFVQTISLTADDQHGNTQSCSFDIRLDDNNAPSIICPADTIANRGGNCEFALEDYTLRAVIDDNCALNGAILSVSQAPIPGTTISGDSKVQSITLTPSDGNGNSFSCGFLLSLDDTTSPGITCPLTQTIFLDRNCQQRTPDFRQLAAITDNCADSVEMSLLQQPVPDSIFSQTDTLPVTLTLNDGHGNEQDCVFTLQVQDTTLPGIQCPADTFIDAGQNCQFAIADYTSAATVVDNCASGLKPVRIAQDIAVGTLIDGLGNSVTVTLTATDVNGNSSSCSFSVTSRSATPPPVVIPVRLGAAELAKDSAIASFDLSTALDPLTPSNMTRLDVDGDGMAGAGPYRVDFFTSDTAAASGLNPIATTYESGDTLVYARIEDPSSGCFTVTPVRLEVLPLPVAPDISLTVCANSINEQVIAASPQLLAQGTSITLHQWSLFDAGTTQANSTSFSPKDQQQTTVTLTNVSFG